VQRLEDPQRAVVELPGRVGAAVALLDPQPQPFAFTNLKTDEGLDSVMSWIRSDVLMLDLD
jgi:Ni2+-binding GTPase involved in maturation of urease and hydrogenase